ncbi:MAG: aminoglycoside phosphotransferase [Alphaproteobacteria bacterium]
MTRALPPAAEAGHLTQALRRAGALGAGQVASVVAEASFATVLSHVFRLRLTFDGPAGGAPGSLILKAGLPDRPGGPWRGGLAEVAFYRDVAPAAPAGLVPRCFEAEADPEAGTWHVLLEDLTDSHAVATRWPLPPTEAQCAAIVEARARFHAAWWNDPRLGASLGTSPALDAPPVRDFADRYARFQAEMGDRLSPRQRDLFERFLDALPRLAERHRGAGRLTILHGDSHVWNCFLPRDGSDDVRLFDWDAWRIGIGTDDLAYMMALHWYPPQRQAFERPMLDRYHAALAAAGVRGLDRDTVGRDYRMSVLWQIATPVTQHAIGIPPLIWWNNLERIHLAVEDLDCRSLLHEER